MTKGRRKPTGTRNTQRSPRREPVIIQRCIDRRLRHSQGDAAAKDDTMHRLWQKVAWQTKLGAATGGTWQSDARRRVLGKGWPCPRRSHSPLPGGV
jgi:hypothetical protein